MRRLVVAAGIMCGFLSGATPDAAAQIGYLWTYDELLQKADVVVIARCGATIDTGNQVSHPELSPRLPVVEMRTTFQVEAILKTADQKRASPGPELRLRHYRLDLERWQKEHPPELGMPPAGLVNAGGYLAPREGRSYLLFLTRAADGLHEPLSGHTFPTD
jgi:hypothetical protein